jgi:hypothetical protein
MIEKDMITMSQKELQRLHVIRKTIDKAITQTRAAEILEMCTRQVRRIASRIKLDGDEGIIHKSRHKPSNSRINPKIKTKVLNLYKTKYHDFGPTLASEKLLELHRIKISDETLRLWLHKGNVSGYKRRKLRPHRQWRQRKECFGQMVQMDGSHHDWFEGRGPKSVLMAYKDDATGKVFARFYKYEGTIPALDSFKRYIAAYGIPQSIYLDKHSTYKSWAKPTIEDQLRGKESLSQFGRAAGELGVKLIYAHSPQAKGRIEREFKTLQDRLVKELRLKKANTIKAANKVLDEYLPKLNSKFSVVPANGVNLHRSVSPAVDLDDVLCIKDKRVVRNDFTVSYEAKLYQITEQTKVKTVAMIEKVDGSIEIKDKQKSLSFRVINQRLKKEPKKRAFKPKVILRPTKHHPWRRFPAIKKHKTAA